MRNTSIRKKVLMVVPVVAVFGVVTAAYILSYRLSSGGRPPFRTGQETEEENADEPEAARIDSQAVPDHGAENGQEGNPALPANEAQEIYITPRMKYQLEVYDTRSAETAKQEEKIPVAMYGLSREELSEYLDRLAEQENKNRTDIEIRYELTAFSRDSFTVRKTVSDKETVYALFLIAEDGYLTAYTGDLTDVYEYTQIPLEDFPLEQQAMLTKGIFMKSLADYYDFLETYSS